PDEPARLSRPTVRTPPDPLANRRFDDLYSATTRPVDDLSEGKETDRNRQTGASGRAARVYLCGLHRGARYPEPPETRTQKRGAGESGGYGGEGKAGRARRVD